MSYFPVGFVNPILQTKISYITQAASGSDVGGGGSYTFTSQSLGNDDGRRWIIVPACARGISIDIPSLTIGGISATKIFEVADVSGEISFWAAYIPTGAAGNIVVSISGTLASRCFIAVYRLLTQFNPTTAFDTDSDVTLTSGHFDLSINVPNSGVCIGAALFAIASSPGITWSGLTEDFERVAPDETTTTVFGAAGGTNVFTSDQTLAIQVTGVTTPSGRLAGAISLR